MYTFRYGGKIGQTYQLVEANDMVVIRTQKEVQLSQLELPIATRALVANIHPIAAFPEAQVTVYRIIDGKEASALSIRNDLRKVLKDQEGIRFTGRVLKDNKTNILYVYTENFFVKFFDDIDPLVCAAILDEFGLAVKEQLTFAVNAFFAEANEGTGLAIFDISQKLLAKTEVEYCHPELLMEKKNKAIHPMQWHLAKATINNQVIDQNVAIEKAWEITKGAGSTICIIDDGVAYDHPEFSAPGKVVFPRDTVQNVNDARPKYANENHGTACAGVACAAGMFKASGVAPEAKLLPIRCGGLGSIAESKAFAWAADKGADVISCSWGPADGAWYNPSDPLHRTNFPLPDSSRLAIEYAATKGRGGKGCVITWAAGNGNEDVQFDGYASYPKVIAVVACNDQGKRSVYSDFGQAVWCAFPSNDVFAPELNHPRPASPGIWTTDRPGNQGYNISGQDAENTLGDLDGNYTATFGGTSSACPGVAGVAALILAVNPNLTWTQVKNILRASCDQIDKLSGGYDANGQSAYYGFGRINAQKAVQNAQATLKPLDVFDISGKANFSQGSEVAITDGVLTSDQYPNNRLMGFQLRLQPPHPEIRVQYRVFIGKQGPSPFAEEGSFAGTRDKRRRIVGFQIQLLGALARDYTVKYEAKVNGSNNLLKGEDGSVCGSASLSGSTILEIRLSVTRRNNS
jgi:subtilisin family serine protease